ncbi:11297_t:CDS:1, partial [Acaulospora colombiana]
QPTRTRKMASKPGNSKVPSRQTDRTLRYERRTVKEATPLRTQPYAKKPNTQTKRPQTPTTRTETKQLRTQTLPDQEDPPTHQTREYTQTEAQQNTLPKQSWDEQ